MSSPYLKPNRLADILAAIQVLSTYKFYKRSFKKWADKIENTEQRASHWQNVFEEHPELFRVGDHSKSADGKGASLVWRRSFRRRYHVDLDREISEKEYEVMSEKEKEERLSRKPLKNDHILALINTAIELHTRALAERQEKGGS